MLKKLAIVITFAISCLAPIRIVTAQDVPASSPKQGVAKEGGSGGSQKATHPDQNKADSSNAPAVANPNAAPGDPEKQQHEEDVRIQRKIANLTAWLVVVGGLQALALLGTLWIVKRQAEWMGVHAGHLEGLAGAASANNVSAMREQRAYLTVIIGQAVYQERRPGRKGGNLRFQCKPVVVNTGRTPAKKLKFNARAGIFAMPLPGETHLPEGFDENTRESILGPQQNAIMNAVLDGFCQDSEVKAIKEATGNRGLYVWGLITYEDVFGKSHYTRFCQHIYWDLANNVLGHYIPNRNDMD